MIRRGIGVQGFVSAVVSTDADAQAFITTAGITDATQQSAINTLVTDLKTYGVWTKMKAIYPFVGGTASAHKFNLKDPRDLDAAFRLVFSGGWTHSSTGALPNGTNGYADSFLQLQNLSNISNHLSAYIPTNLIDNKSVIGAYDGGTRFTILGTSTSSISTGMYYCSYNLTFGCDVNTTRSGFLAGSYISGTERLFKNGSLIKTNTIINTASTSTRNFYLGALNSNGTAGQFMNNQFRFASIGDGLTDTEAANLYTAVQAYQTTLSRNV